MRQDPFGRGDRRPAGRAPRRGINLRFVMLLLFAGYGLYYYVSNRSTDPVTGETVLIDRALDVEDEKALGLEAYEQILQQERPVPADSEIARDVRAIADRLIAKVAVVEAELAREELAEAQGVGGQGQLQETVAVVAHQNSIHLHLEHKS